MTPNKKNTHPPNQVLTLRIPAEIMRQLDELGMAYKMNRSQLIFMVIAKEYGVYELRAHGVPVTGDKTEG